MTKQDSLPKHFIVFSSPSGSTRTIAFHIQATIKEQTGQNAALVDLGAVARREIPRPRPQGPVCLWVGSPVYAKHILPLVQDFLSSLEPCSPGLAVPFVTWGGVSSGTALEELAQGLDQAGCHLLGGLKVLAKHSVLAHEDQPLGARHPDQRDLYLLRILVQRVLDKTRVQDPASYLEPRNFAYAPPQERQAAKQASLEAVRRRLPPLRVDAQACIQCGHCAEVCPAGAIQLRPEPVIGPECICCDLCRRECPEEALSRDDASVDPGTRLRQLAFERGEKPDTRLFF